MPEVEFVEWIKMYDEQPWIADRIEQLQYDLKMIKTMNPYAAINYIRRGIGYEEYLREYAQYRSISAEDLIDILDELQESAKGYKSYTEWVDHIATYTQEMKRLMEKRMQAKDAVTLATFHSAKGLEFDRVFLVDVNEDVIPYKKAVLDKDIEEERRLFYVGMTRARNRLYICSVASMREEDMQVSRFVEESKGKKEK